MNIYVIDLTSTEFNACWQNIVEWGSNFTQFSLWGTSLHKCVLESDSLTIDKNATFRIFTLKLCSLSAEKHKPIFRPKKINVANQKHTLYYEATSLTKLMFRIGKRTKFNDYSKIKFSINRQSFTNDFAIKMMKVMSEPVMEAKGTKSGYKL